MEEGLAAEHGGELLRDSLEQLLLIRIVSRASCTEVESRCGLCSHLDGSGVADEGGGHLETSGRDVADGGLDVVGDPRHFIRKTPGTIRFQNPSTMDCNDK